MTRTLLVLVAALVLTAPRVHAARSPDVERRWADAVASLRAAVSAVPPVSPARAGAVVQQFEALLASPHLTVTDRARVHSNLARAYELAGDPGRARLALRRAEHLAPGLPGVRDRLRDARSGPSKDGPAADRTDASPLDEAAALALSIPRRTTFIATLASWALLWTLIGVVRPCARLRAPVLAAMGACGAIAVGGGFLTFAQLRRDAIPDAVMLKASPAYAGPDALIFSSTGDLPAGTEVAILEVRPGADGRDWARVRPLARGVTTDSSWVPAGVAERVVFADASVP